jgi:uncharacterized membrane protein YqjE
MTTERHAPIDHDRSLGPIVAEIKEEVKQLINTRVQMTKDELGEAIAAARTALPLSLVAFALLSLSFILFTLAAVALVAAGFAGHPYAWFLASLIVGCVWLGLAGIAAFFAYKALRSRGGFLKRTAAVLKADSIWLQTEARSHS